MTLYRLYQLIESPRAKPLYHFRVGDKIQPLMYHMGSQHPYTLKPGPPSLVTRDRLDSKGCHRVLAVPYNGVE